MARSERIAIAVVCAGLVAACNLVAGLGGFEDVACEPCSEAGDAPGLSSPDEGPGNIQPDAWSAEALEAGRIDDAAGPFDATLDAGSDAQDSGPGDAAQDADAGTGDAGPSADYHWARWSMPNSADSGLPNPARYVPVPGTDGGVLDIVTGLQWGPVYGATSLAAATTACSPARVPTRIELVSILDLQAPGPLVNPAFTTFPPPPALFWTSPYPDAGVWTVDFGQGTIGLMAGATWVVCVQSGTP